MIFTTKLQTGAAQADRSRTPSSSANARSTRALVAVTMLLGLATFCYGQSPASAAIAYKYATLGGASGFLGSATSAVTPVGDGAGYYQKFQNGAIYWTQATSAHEVHGMILAKYNAIGGTAALGYATTDETSGKTDPNVRYNHFQRGTIGWKSATGAHEVHGDIWLKYVGLGGPDGFLGAPLTDESATVDSVGRYNQFAGGAIYWTPATGAHEIHGLICQRWANLGWERSYLGYPVSDEQVTPNLTINGAAQGRVSAFQHGRIYYTPNSGAVDVQDLAEVWEPRQKNDFRASTTGTRKLLTIIYNTHTTPQQVDSKCTTTPRCTTLMPAPFVGDIQSVLFGTKPNEPPPNPSLPKVNASDFMRENSGPSSSSAPNGRIMLMNAGILEIDAPLAKQGKHYWNDSLHQPNSNDGWLSGHAERNFDAITLASTQKGFDFTVYDTNHDKLLTSDELAIIVVVPGEGDWGDVVPAYGGYKSGVPFDLKAGGVDGVTIRNSNHWEILEWFTHPAATKPIMLGLPTHELGHLLVGVPDLYSTGWKYDAGLFSRMSAGCSSCETTHFDPFLKLKAKWLDYTVITGTGQYTYTLRNVEQFGEGLVLYDPTATRGRKEYFILEYRRPGSSYDAGRAANGGGLPNAGLAVWHIVEDAAAQKLLNPPAAANNWYRQGVLLERANGGSPIDDSKALFGTANTPLFLNWSDGSSTGFKVVLQSGTSAAPDSVSLTITR
jgi:M6 family metalloprotease-like protein